MRWAKALACGSLFWASFGCSPKEPPRWAEGGAALAITPARWNRADDDTIEILQNGQVVEDGDPIFLVDRAGRIVDEDNEPVAILLPDGFVAGTDNRLLGRVGNSNAAPPNAAAAWIAIMPNGQVVYFDEDGERSSDGAWQGCNGPQLRTCTLITHVIALRRWAQRAQRGVTFGVGLGVGF
jgi:hypothetical protein